MPRPVRLIAAACLALAACSEPDPPLALDVWHGASQRVGHLGDAQDDFNLMGIAQGRELSYRLNGGAPVTLTLPREAFGFRRLGGSGHFNADIPIGELHLGSNAVVLTLADRAGATLERTVNVERLAGSTPLPYRIDWSDVSDAQNVGQYVDGEWQLTPDGLRCEQLAYDRLFLIGERTWRDYDVRTSVTIHQVAAETAPRSGGNAVGLLMRFAGHSTGGPLEFPEAQPVWGYLPFGTIGWLRWVKGEPAGPATVEHYRGDRNELASFATHEVKPGSSFNLRMTCETLPETATGLGATRYRFKVWQVAHSEPEAWAFDIVQESDFALTSGGLALVAHHVDATFGDVTISALE